MRLDFIKFNWLGVEQAHGGRPCVAGSLVVQTRLVSAFLLQQHWALWVSTLPAHSLPQRPAQIITNIPVTSTT